MAHDDDSGPSSTGPEDDLTAAYVEVMIQLQAGDLTFIVHLSKDGDAWRYRSGQVQEEFDGTSLPSSGKVIAADHHDARRRVAAILAEGHQPGTTERDLFDLLATFSK